MRIAAFAIIAVLFVSAVLATDAHAHSMTGPFRVDTQTYFMKPGDTVAHDVRICAAFPDQLTVNDVTFKGKNSGWAKVDTKQLPVTAAPAAGDTASVTIPVTITVPSNFTGGHSLVHMAVGAQFRNFTIPLESDLRVIITNSTVGSQNLPECKSLVDIQTSLLYNASILGSVGAGLGAVGYFAYWRSKAKSPKHKAGMGTKIILILLATIGFFLITGAFLLLRSFLM